MLNDLGTRPPPFPEASGSAWRQVVFNAGTFNIATRPATTSESLASGDTINVSFYDSSFAKDAGTYVLPHENVTVCRKNIFNATPHTASKAITVQSVFSRGLTSVPLPTSGDVLTCEWHEGTWYVVGLNRELLTIT